MGFRVYGWGLEVWGSGFVFCCFGCIVIALTMHPKPLCAAPTPPRSLPSLGPTAPKFENSGPKLWGRSRFRNESEDSFQSVSSQGVANLVHVEKSSKLKSFTCSSRNVGKWSQMPSKRPDYGPRLHTSRPQLNVENRPLLQVSYPLSAETLEPLARFVRKLPKDSNFAEEGFPGLKNQNFLGSFSANHSMCSA